MSIRFEMEKFNFCSFFVFCFFVLIVLSMEGYFITKQILFNFLMVDGRDFCGGVIQMFVMQFSEKRWIVRRK